MRGEEIIRIGLERGLFTTRARDADSATASLIGTLHSEITRTPNRRGFVSLGHSTFGLARWGSSPKPPVVSQPRRTSTHIPAPVALPAGITLDKLERIRQVMSTDEFRQDWGEVYDQLLAAERAKAITPVNDRYLQDRVRPVVQRIQDFLQGHGNDSPKSEVVCDWIYLCYTLELHREGAALWRYVNQDEVDALKYERTSKFSAACRTRVGL